MSTSLPIKNSSLYAKPHLQPHHLRVSGYYVPVVHILNPTQIESTGASHRIISDTELDRIVTCKYLRCFSPARANWHIQLSSCPSTVAKASRSSGEILSYVQRRKSTSGWSITVRSSSHFLYPSLVMTVCLETGGLFRMAVKLMMAHATTNTEVCVPIPSSALILPNTEYCIDIVIMCHS